MFWSPNEATSSDLQGWWPGPDYVDIVGIDWYPKDSTATFASVYGDFYNAFAKQYNKHFCIGETGFDGGSTSDKEAWVEQLANSDVSAFPCYKSTTWFEYHKDGDDFRIIQGQSAATIKQTLSNFA